MEVKAIHIAPQGEESRSIRVETDGEWLHFHFSTPHTAETLSVTKEALKSSVLRLGLEGEQLATAFNYRLKDLNGKEPEETSSTIFYPELKYGLEGTRITSRRLSWIADDSAETYIFELEEFLPLIFESKDLTLWGGVFGAAATHPSPKRVSELESTTSQIDREKQARVRHPD